MSDPEVNAAHLVHYSLTQCLFHIQQTSAYPLTHHGTMPLGGQALAWGRLEKEGGASGIKNFFYERGPSHGNSPSGRQITQRRTTSVIDCNDKNDEDTLLSNDQQGSQQGSSP